MIRRQPELGSALGLDTATTITHIDQALKRTTRTDLTAALATALTATGRHEPAIDITLKLHRTLDGMLNRWPS